MRVTFEHERLLVLLISVHSFVVGLMLLLAPEWAVRFGGWAGIDPPFFVRQAGIFHLVLVCGYLIEHVRYRGVHLLVTAKLIALVFLLVASILDQVPWAVPACGLADGAMAAAVLVVHRAVLAHSIPSREATSAPSSSNVSIT